MKQSTQAFRTRLRTGIHPLYNPWRHDGFVLVFGLLCIPRTLPARTGVIA
ncbi:hypothetical protein [Pseudomonas fluorescens]|uniref:Uncharacterized protein n=1 Tax=Pseudomonas fluorescens TaxID=294 RepID=A0A5E7EPG3_PSEFL|nr:hypothetical protein [Pseudomonas fluorescens]VVO28740.1 hypothetical protein PS691_04767 [Pseudomonas fluorescens]